MTHLKIQPFLGQVQEPITVDLEEVQLRNIQDLFISQAALRRCQHKHIMYTHIHHILYICDEDLIKKDDFTNKNACEPMFVHQPGKN